MNFMKTFWAALLAFVVANVLLFLLSFMIFASMAAFMGSSVPTVKDGSVLRIDLAGGISDSPSESAISSMDLFGGIEFDHTNSLYSVLTAINKAADDTKIKGIYINLKEGASISIYEELRGALLKFKESGKFIIAYNENYGQGNYYLSSVADKVYVHPMGGMTWVGMSGTVMFYKGLLDKLGIEMQILRHGTFKSAVEPYMLNHMSEANRLQYDVMLNAMWGTIVGDIAVSRGIDSLALSQYATDLSILEAKDAVSHKLVDGILYEDQVNEMLKKLIEGKTIDEAYGFAVSEEYVKTEDEKKSKEKGPELLSLSDYIASGASATHSTSKNKVAIVYADGSIIDGENSPGNVGGTTMMEKLARVREDKNVKAVVFRVNSPGGSALASDLMWREVELISRSKPIIVSMGSLAASGGYWISSPADVILADRTTLTGSIGVFGMMPYIGKAMEDKLGITVDIVKTNPHADFGNVFRKLSDKERETIMTSIRDIYAKFLEHVSEGRNMTTDAVDKIGEGRVWAGLNALEIGLIDAYGGLTDAIALAADRAGLGEDFRVWEVVEYPDDIFAKLRSFGMIFGGKSPVSGEIEEAMKYYNQIREMVSEQGVQARLPYIMETNL